jgi:hypothetical protein
MCIIVHLSAGQRGTHCSGERTQPRTYHRNRRPKRRAWQGLGKDGTGGPEKCFAGSDCRTPHHDSGGITHQNQVHQTLTEPTTHLLDRPDRNRVACGHRLGKVDTGRSGPARESGHGTVGGARSES